MNTSVYNPQNENRNRVNNAAKMTDEERRAMVGTADTMATPKADDWKKITLDQNDPAAVMRLVCTTPDGLPSFTAGWTDRAAALRWFEEEKTAHKNEPHTRIIEESATRLVFAPKNGTAQYVHELRPVVPADILNECKAAQCWTVSKKYNYGPIKALIDYAYKVTTSAGEWCALIDDYAQKVTDAKTYCIYLLSSFDVWVDMDHIICDMRRAFPAVGFREVCKMIRENMSDNQHTDGVSLALVPDVVLIESEDEATREKFRKRHETFYKLSSYWHGDEVNTAREGDLRKRYDLDSLALHFMLSEELYYYWSKERAAACLEKVQQVRPEATAEDLRRVYEETKHGVSELYD